MSNQSERDANRLEAAERREKALRLRLAGATYEEIGRAFNVNKSTAKRWIDTSIANVEKETATELVTLENMRLDVAQRAIMPNVAKGHLGAVDRLIRIMERRARLNGIDAPQRVDLNTEPVDLDQVTNDILDALKNTPEEPHEHEGTTCE